MSSSRERVKERRIIRDLLAVADEGSLEDLKDLHTAGLTANQVSDTAWALKAMCATGKLDMIQYVRDAMGVPIGRFRAISGFTQACGGGHLPVMRYFADDAYYGLVTTDEVRVGTFLACQEGRVPVLAYMHRQREVSAVDVIKWHGEVAAAQQGRLGIFVYLHEIMGMAEEGVIEGIEDGTNKSADTIYMSTIRLACEAGHPLVVAYLMSMSGFTPGDVRALREELQGSVDDQCLRELNTLRRNNDDE